jgi:hypothetical protein
MCPVSLTFDRRVALPATERRPLCGYEVTMTNDHTKVSRLEFYQALSSVWLFISFAFCVRLPTSHGVDVMLYFLVSFMMTVVYSVIWFKLWRNRQRQPAAA